MSTDNEPPLTAEDVAAIRRVAAILERAAAKAERESKKPEFDDEYPDWLRYQR